MSNPVDERVLTVNDLARMFNVSTKTVSRWRDHGLASAECNVKGRPRVRFLKSSVDEFVAQNPDRVRRGANFSQLTDEERSEMITRARVLADAGQAPAAVAKELASSLNRSVETVRATIKRHDTEHPDAAIFGDSQSPLSEGPRTRIYRQYRRGASLETLARNFQRPLGQIRSIILQKRAERILELPLEYMPSDEFDQEESDTTILAPLPQPEYTSRKTRAPSGLPSYLASLYDFPLLTKEQEVHLFRQYNYAKYRAAQLREKLDPKRPSEKLLNEIEQLYQLAVDTKNQIMQANLRLVVSIAKKHGVTAEGFQDLISDGNMSLLKAIEKFDYTRGFKFSTYATWAIKRNYAGSYVKKIKQADRYRTSQEETLDTIPAYRADHYAVEAAQARHEAAINQILDCLDARERGIIERRYGFGDRQKPQTLKEIGADLQVSKERVRQIESRALAKLRDAANAQQLEALVG